MNRTLTTALARPFAAPSFSLTGVMSRAFSMRSVARQRRALSKLDDTILNDIGLSRSEANQEANRSAWDVPNTWRV